ncbi:MAG: cell surface protein, partial [Acidobacteria bacterium]
VDTTGNAYVTGSTTGSFPTTVGAYQTTYGGGGTGAFVTKLNALASPLYSTYLG